MNKNFAELMASEIELMAKKETEDFNFYECLPKVASSVLLNTYNGTYGN